MRAIIRKELWSIFGQYTGWLIIAGFSIISTLFLFFFENEANIFDIGTASLQSFFGLCPWLLMFIIPALTMRTFSEEEQEGTLLILFSLPLRISSLVYGKFISVFIVGILCLIPSLSYIYTIDILGIPQGNYDGGAMLGSYFGLILLLSVFVSVGIFCSAWAKNQVVAYLLGLVLSFILFFGIQQLSSYRLLGGLDYFLSEVGIYSHYISFSRGVIDSRDMAYFVLLFFVFLQGTIFLINRKKIK